MHTAKCCALYGMTILLINASICWAKPALDKRTCQAITTATYQPGVDAYGRKVAPVTMSHNYLEDPTAFSNAALKQAPKFVPDEIRAPLTVELMSYLKGNQGRHLAESEATIGVLRIKGTDIYLNDKPLTQNQKTKLTDLCKE